MSNQELSKITSGQFYNAEADFYYDAYSDEVYMTIEQVANCLGYESRSGIDKMLQKHEYLTTSEFSIKENLSSILRKDREYITTLITEDGLYEISMLSHKPKAKEFRAFVRTILKGLRKGELKLTQTNNTILAELSNIQITLTQIQSQLQRQESLIYTLVPKYPYSEWKNKMTTKIKPLEQKHNTEFKTILRQIYGIMKTNYNIPLDLYAQDYLLQNPDKTKISMYELITLHTELHGLFEELVEHYEELILTPVPA